MPASANAAQAAGRAHQTGSWNSAMIAGIIMMRSHVSAFGRFQYD
jgi:hypothetical protein